MKPAGPHGVPRVALLVESSRSYGRGILRGIARYAHAHGPWSLFTAERDLHGGVPELFSTWRGSGVIARIENRRMAGRLLRLGCPVVDVLGQAKLPGIPSFDTDAEAVARIAGEFFLRAGFQHFAFAGYPGVPFSDRRKAAFAACVGDHGHAVRVLPAITAASQRKNIQAIELAGIAAERAIANWLKHQAGPLAVLACNDVRGQQVLNACREHNIRVPEEVAVMGVDNDDVLCALCEPPLSSIEPDTERLGYEAAALLAALMRGQRCEAAVTQIPPLGLVERCSTDTVAIDDPVTARAVRFIRDNVNRGVAVKDVLAHVQRSRTDLEQRFSRALKSSVRQEILRRRFERVCSLLRQTNFSLNEIAERAGFSSASHLCRVFQHRYRQSPTAYRGRFESANRIRPAFSGGERRRPWAGG
jgi:LacI family transcriptional regulator